jgi:hypothetical protein
MEKDSATPARVPAFVEPMKAKLVDSIPPGDWIYEIKFDGYRALALRGGSETRLLSRNEKDLGSKFPEVKDSIAALDVQDSIIDYAGSDDGRASIVASRGRTRCPARLAAVSPAAGMCLKRMRQTCRTIAS